MPAWTNITNALVAVGAKPFASTMQALRDNPIAAFEGDPSAVAAGITLRLGALERLAVGSDVRLRDDATVTAPLRAVASMTNIGFLQAGTVRFTCQHRTTGAATTSTFRVQRTRAGSSTNFDKNTNSTSFVSETTDVGVQPGDSVTVSFLRSGALDIASQLVRMQVATGQIVYPGPNMQGFLENPAI